MKIFLFIVKSFFSQIMKTPRKVFAILLIISVLAIVYIFYTKKSILQLISVDNVKTNNLQQDPNDVKYILMWTWFFYWKNWKLQQDTSDQNFFKTIGCPETRCVLTSDRSLKKIQEYDAILFHSVHGWDGNPDNRTSRQLYIAGMLEPPERTMRSLSNFDNFFNMTSEFLVSQIYLLSTLGSKTLKFK